VRRILFVSMLAALLLGFVFLSRALANWHYVLPAEQGTLLYIATFDGFNEDWARYAGRLSSEIVDGALRLNVGEPVAGPYSVASPYFGDFDVHLQARAVDGPETNGFGIVFREQDPNNFYTFLISSDGFYQVVRSLDGKELELSNWIETPYVNVGIGSENALRVVGRGNHFQFYVNDQPLLLCIPDDPDAISTYYNGTCVDGTMRDALVDTSFPTGRLGVIATTVQGGGIGVVVDFDNIVVYGPEAAS
jgi:hypothetical protein